MHAQGRFVVFAVVAAALAGAPIRARGTGSNAAPDPGGTIDRLVADANAPAGDGSAAPAQAPQIRVPDAPATAQWINGAPVYTWHNNCLTGMAESLSGHHVGYFGDSNLTYPKVGDLYYGHIVVATLGNPCGGPYMHVEVWPPPATSIVNNATYPIRCYYTNPQGQTNELTDGSCPVAASLPTGMFGGWNLDSRPVGSWAGGPWPLPQGGILEIWFPMISGAPMSGIATNSYMYGLVKVLDGGASPYNVASEGVFVAPATTGVGCPASAKGDFNNDGRPDLVWRNLNSNRHMLWTMNGTARAASQWVSPDPPAGLQAVGSDDFNRDNRTDLVFANPATGDVQFWMMNGGTRLGAAVTLAGALAPPWRVAATGDFSGDGKPDLVWRNYDTQKILVWTMDGTTKTGQIVPNPDQAADPNWEIVAALDLNGDGQRDLLWYNWSSGKIVSWYMDQNVQRLSGQFTNPPNAGDANWKVYAGGDYSGSAATLCANDIVWRNATSGRAVVWQMDTAGNRVAGGFTTPDGPSADPSGNPTNLTDWILAGPR